MKFVIVCASLLFSVSAIAEEPCHDLLNYEAQKLRSKQTVDFCREFSGKAVLFVNTASQCGYTPQFKGLEQLNKKYGDKLAIVGFPSDDFNQEYDDTEKVADVCYVNYGVTFTMMAPSSVKGENANAIFKLLAERTGQEPQWNFNKYLVSADGNDVQHFSSSVAPDDKGLIEKIDAVVN